MSYQSESSFKQALLRVMRSHGLMCTCVETGKTSQGVPDVFVMGRGGDIWIELKNEPERTLQDKEVLKVDWRPGQQAWMWHYFLAHNTNKCCLTIVALKDSFGIITMSNGVLFEQNMVPKGSIIEVQSLGEIAKVVGESCKFYAHT